MTTRRKPARGGKRPGAGAPRTTGSSTTKPVTYRLSAEAYAQAEVAARAAGLGVNAFARVALLALLDGRVTPA